MSSKAGYKVVLNPGEELLAILDNTRAERREQPLSLQDRSMPEPPGAQAQRRRARGRRPAEATRRPAGQVPSSW